jgi:hypothetical protein
MSPSVRVGLAAALLGATALAAPWRYARVIEVRVREHVDHVDADTNTALAFAPLWRPPAGERGLPAPAAPQLHVVERATGARVAWELVAAGWGAAAAAAWALAQRRHGHQRRAP